MYVCRNLIFYQKIRNVKDLLPSTKKRMNVYRGIAIGLVYFGTPFLLFRGLVSQDPYRLQSVCSSIVSLLLAPTGIRETLGWVGTALQQKQTAEWYAVYTITDMLLGLLYYPQHMRWLEGWLHHAATGWFALYCLKTDRCHLLSACMIVEVPTVFLSLPRVFPVLGSLRRHVFPPVFALCRLGLFNLNVGRLWRTGGLRTGEILFALGFNCLNAHWFYQTLLKKAPRRAPRLPPTA
jgi:hypothetical protein